MSIFNKVTDHFKKSDFSVSPGKKVKTIKKEFKEAFGLSLRIYKGKQFAEESLTINQLNKKTSAEIKTAAVEDLVIRASFAVGKVEKLFKTTYGLDVQIADADDKKLINDKITLGDARR